MSIDGFSEDDKNAFVGFSPAIADRIYGLIGYLARRLEVEYAGLDNLPSGRALLVANHTFGWDIAFPMGEIRRRTGRTVWAMGEHLWWKVPFLRRLAAGVGTVDGTPDNMDRLLAGEELVVVLPGGLRESLKPRELRYRLLWGHRYGFIRAAIRNRTPICPLAALGSDELFDLVGDAQARGERWLGRFAIPLPLPARIWPLPRGIKLRYVVGKPIVLPAEPGQEEDPEVLRSCRYLVESALQELIDRELACRPERPPESNEPKDPKDTPSPKAHATPESPESFDKTESAEDAPSSADSGRPREPRELRGPREFRQSRECRGDPDSVDSGRPRESR